MLTTLETIAEAKRALDEYLRRERYAPLARQGTPQRTFAAEGGLDTDFDTGDNLGQISEARESARRYVESKHNHNRPVRQIDENNQAAIEGRDSALAYIEKRKRSGIRK
jgi:hypothetical protein